jgi:hypothetical protein
MSVIRIELTERYVIEPDEDEVETAKNLGLPIPEGKVKFRRIFPRVEDIHTPREIPGIKSYCEIEYVDGVVIRVKGSYDEIAILINDRENMEEDKEEEAGD